MIKLNNGQVNSLFLKVTDTKTKNSILDAIANHYGIERQEAFAEVTDAEAEHLLEYLTGSVRTATSLLMKRHGLMATA